MNECCQDYYDIEKGHKAYHCSGEPNPHFYLPRKKNLAQFEVVHCQCTCHIGKKPKLKTSCAGETERYTTTTLPPGLKKGEQIQFLIRQDKSNEEILLQIKTTVNSIRWHRSKIKGADHD